MIWKAEPAALTTNDIYNEFVAEAYLVRVYILLKVIG